MYRVTEFSKKNQGALAERALVYSLSQKVQALNRPKHTQQQRGTAKPHLQNANTKLRLQTRDGCWS